MSIQKYDSIPTSNDLLEHLAPGERPLLAGVGIGLRPWGG